MKTLVSISLFLVLATIAPAQRRGGGGFSGGRIATGHRGFSGGSYGGFRGGIRGGYAPYRGYSSSWYRGYGGFAGFYGLGSWGYGYGFAGGYWPSYGYGWSYPTYYGYGGYYSPSVTVVYGPPATVNPTTVYVERVRPVPGSYDEWGQQRSASNDGRATSVYANASPIYLIEFRDGVIRAATSYRVEGTNLLYVTEQGEQKSAPLDTVDRERSVQLNRERRVSFRLP